MRGGVIYAFYPHNVYLCKVIILKKSLNNEDLL